MAEAEVAADRKEPKPQPTEHEQKLSQLVSEVTGLVQVPLQEVMEAVKEPTAVLLWREICTFLPAEQVNPGATQEELNQLTDNVALYLLPPSVVQLLHTSNGISYAVSERLGGLWFPSTSDIVELYNYNEQHGRMFRALHWLPWHQIDCDFAFEVLDVASGAVIFLDYECGGANVVSCSFEKRLEAVLTLLRQKREQDQLKESDATWITQEELAAVDPERPFREAKPGLYYRWHRRFGMSENDDY